MAKIESAAFGGQHTPAGVIAEGFEYAEEADAVVVVMKLKNGDVRVGWSDSFVSDRMGILEFAKQVMWESKDD